MSKNTCEVCSKIFYSDGNTCNECATNMDGVERNKYHDIAPDITPSIEEMSEVVAKYMGIEKRHFLLNDKDVYYYGLNGIAINTVAKYDSSWDWNRIHEVWEKFRGTGINGTEEDYNTLIFHKGEISNSLVIGSLQDTFISLKNAIDFINSLKK